MLTQVLTSINSKLKRTSFLNILSDFFTQPATNIPQNSDHLYRFNIGDRVKIHLPISNRRALNFKWSLNFGGLAETHGVIADRRITLSRAKQLIPYYEVTFKNKQVKIFYYFMKL